MLRHQKSDIEHTMFTFEQSKISVWVAKTQWQAFLEVGGNFGIFGNTLNQAFALVPKI